MNRINRLLPILLLLGVLSGCATMSKKECLNANWEALGYSDGSRGVHYSYLEKRRESCLEYEVVPDDAAYRSGWDQGIRRYCTSSTGYNLGTAGRPYQNICPADVAAEFRSGWEQGIAQFCTPENGLRQGLDGYPYRGVCPPHLAPAYNDFFRLGTDIHRARADYQQAEHHVRELEHNLAAEQERNKHRDMLHQLEKMQRAEAVSEARLIALEACMSNDWYETGYRDGEEGYQRRSGEIASLCSSYGIAPDHGGYNEGWRQGVGDYCTYETGLYLGQTNQYYSGVCTGYAHREFWRGYERGRGFYLKEQYEAHPRPTPKRPLISHPEKEKPLPVYKPLPNRPGNDRDRKKEERNGGPEQSKPANWSRPAPEVSIPENNRNPVLNKKAPPAPDAVRKPQENDGNRKTEERSSGPKQSNPANRGRPAPEASTPGNNRNPVLNKKAPPAPDAKRKPQVDDKEKRKQEEDDRKKQ